MFDPKYPEAFFEVYNQLKNQAEELQTSLMREASQTKVDNFRFFDEIKNQQIELTNSQKQLHHDVIAIENKWAQAESVSASHKQYRQAVSFFNQKEQEIDAVTKKMQDLTLKIAEVPAA